MNSIFNLQDADFPHNPFDAFKQWFDEASSNTQIPDATAMTLATSSKNGRPSARVVLLKEFNHNGFTFFTNEQSHKGKNLLQNTQAEACFYWEPLGRQIRIYGKVEKVSDEESNTYFASRHINSQIGASVSKQSSVLPSYQKLKDDFTEFASQNPKPSRPLHWCGFRIIPLEFEFWQNGNFRLHLRHKFKLIENTWQHSLLYP